MTWLAFYNAKAVGDVLLLTCGKVGDDFAEVDSKGDVTVVSDRRTHQPLAVNIFDISKGFLPEGNGPVSLTEDQVQSVNQRIQAAGFDLTIEVDNSPKFVVGYVESCVPHEDSDHLSITQTNVGDETVQIVCGAKNIRQGLKVLVARPGAVMPSGAIIWPGELRGVKSDGMICSTRELGLTEIEDYPGIWELKDSLEAGTPLDQVVASYQ